MAAHPAHLALRRHHAEFCLIDHRLRHGCLQALPHVGAVVGVHEPHEVGRYQRVGTSVSTATWTLLPLRRLAPS